MGGEMGANVTEQKQLTPRQLRALRMLVGGANVATVANDIGCAAKTVYAWLKLPAFIGELRQAEDAAIDAATRRLVALATEAADVLGAVLADPTVTDTVRLRAAATVLDNLLRLRELRDFENRLTALEEAKRENDA